MNTSSSFFAKTAGIALLVLVLAAGSCGYQLTTDMPGILGDGTKTLKVKEVDYPTLDAWLPYALRSSLRDEIGARKLAVWVDSGSADYEISLNVISYTSREWMRNEDDGIVLFDSSLVVEAIVYDGRTNKEIWRSGALYYSERLDTPGERSGSGELITQIMRQLCDRLRNTF